MRATLLVLFLLLAGCVQEAPAAVDEPEPVEPAGAPTAEPTPRADPAPTSPAPASPQPAPAASEEPRLYEESFALKFTELRTEQAMAGAIGANCVFLEGGGAWEVAGGTARVEWSAQTPASAELVLRARAKSGEARVDARGPSPLEVEVPAGAVKGEGAWVFAVNVPDDAGLAVDQELTLALSLRVRGTFEPREASCSIS